jgi:hypothetical protein
LWIVFADVKSANTSMVSVSVLQIVCLRMQMLQNMPKYHQSSPNMVCVEPFFLTTRGSHFHENSLTITFCGFVRSYMFVPPYYRKCIPPRCGSAMVIPIPQDGFGPLDFSSDILREFDFGTEFACGQEFSFEGGGS